MLQKLFAPASPEELARKRRLAEELIRQQREMLKQERKLRRKLKVMLATFKSAQVERFKRQRKRQRADLEMRRASNAVISL